MRGSPLLRALAAFLILLLLGLPVWRLTHARAVVLAPGQGSDAAPREVRIEITFTTTPSSFRVRHLGKEIWTESSPSAEIEKTILIPYPKAGVDLQFEAKYPDSAPLAAMRVKLTNPSGDEAERSAWGRGEIDETLTFP